MRIAVPPLKENASAALECYPARERDMTSLRLPPTLIPNWKKEAIRKFGDLLGKYRSLRLFLDICVRCGACADKCQFFLGTGDPRNMPVARAELLRKVYRRYFTLSGRLFRGLVGAEDLTEGVLREWFTYFYQCSECRRCSVFCPYGIDTAELTMAAREIMAHIGLATRYITEVVVKVHELGNNLGIPPLAWKDNCQFLEGELKEATGKDIRMPVDEEGAEVLLVMPSADNFGEPHVYTMMAYAILFHHLGVGWTTSTYCNEGGNFGLFLNYYHLKRVNKRILDAARQLRVRKMIVWGE